MTFTIKDLEHLLDDPMAELLPKDERGIYYTHVEIGKAKCHPSLLAAAKRRGYEIERLAAGSETYRIFAAKWHVRPCQMVTENRIGMEYAQMPIRETRPDQERLSPLASFLFDTFKPGAVIICYGKDGRHFPWRGFFRPIQYGEREVDYWNAFGQFFSDDIRIFRVGDYRFPHDDFLDEFTKEGFNNELAMEQVVADMKRPAVAQYNW